MPKWAQGAAPQKSQNALHVHSAQCAACKANSWQWAPCTVHCALCTVLWAHCAKCAAYGTDSVQGSECTADKYTGCTLQHAQCTCRVKCAKRHLHGE